MRALYGIREKMLKRYFEQASRKKKGIDIEFLRLLEERLDNVVFRLGWANSRSQARQFVNHKHIVVNKRVVNIPSYRVKVGDTIEVKKQSLKLKPFEHLDVSLKNHSLPSWLSYGRNKGVGKIVSLPAKEDLALPFDVSLVIEFYGR